MTGSSIDLGQRPVGGLVPVDPAARDVGHVVVGQVLGGPAPPAPRDGPGEAGPLLDREHAVLPRGEQPEGGAQSRGFASFVTGLGHRGCTRRHVGALGKRPEPPLEHAP